MFYTYVRMLFYIYNTSVFIYLRVYVCSCLRIYKYYSCIFLFTFLCVFSHAFLFACIFVCIVFLFEYKYYLCILMCVRLCVSLSWNDVCIHLSLYVYKRYKCMRVNTRAYVCAGMFRFIGQCTNIIFVCWYWCTGVCVCRSTTVCMCTNVFCIC